MSAWGYVSLLFILKYLFIYLAEPGLSHDVISLKFVLACRIFSCGMGTLSCIIWDLVPWPGWEPQALLWECRILATEPPGNSLTSYYIILLGKKISLLHIGGNNSTLNLYIPIPSFHNYEYFANLFQLFLPATDQGLTKIRPFLLTSSEGWKTYTRHTNTLICTMK